MTDVLLVLADEALHPDLARCSAAAGYSMVAADPTSCRHQWLRSTAVAVDGRGLAALASTRPPRRGGVMVVGSADGDPAAWRAGLGIGAQGGFVLPAQESAFVGALSDLREPAGRPAPSVAFVGAHGGAGATALAVAVALRAAADGHDVLLLDTDQAGPGADLMLGVEDQAGLRWPDVTGETGTIAGHALRAAVPRRGRVSVVAGDRDRTEPLRLETVLAVADAGRAAGDLVVADVGREPGAVTAGLLDTVDVTVLVTTASVHAVAAARRTAARLLGERDTLLVVRGPAPSGLTATQVADAVGVPLLGGFRPEPSLPERCEGGGLRLRRRGPLSQAARVVCTRLVERPAVRVR